MADKGRLSSWPGFADAEDNPESEFALDWMDFLSRWLLLVGWSALFLANAAETESMNWSDDGSIPITSIIFACCSAPAAPVVFDVLEASVPFGMDMFDAGTDEDGVEIGLEPNALRAAAFGRRRQKQKGANL